MSILKPPIELINIVGFFINKEPLEEVEVPSPMDTVQSKKRKLNAMSKVSKKLKFMNGAIVDR